MKKGYYLYGNKGDLWSNKLHIAKSGSVSGTLCRGVISRHNASGPESKAGCPECKRIYECSVDVLAV